MTELKLPQHILAKASVSPNGEHGWQKEDFIEAILAAKQIGLATIGGQVQFQFEDGTCEAYWLSYDSSDREPGEDWNIYVKRSANEVIQRFKCICAETDFHKEAMTFDLIQKKDKAEKVDVLKSLWFMAYFCSEED